MASSFGPLITSPDIEDAVTATLQRWLPTMLGEVERRSDGRWAVGQVQRPRSWQLVTDYEAPTADRRLPCVAVEYGPQERILGNEGAINSENGLTVYVITKGQDRDKTRETLGALVAAICMVLEKHGDLDGFAVGTEIGTINPDAIAAAKAKTVAGAGIPIAVLVDNVASRWGGPSEPDPPDEPPPASSPEDPQHTSTNVTVDLT